MLCRNQMPLRTLCQNVCGRIVHTKETGTENYEVRVRFMQGTASMMTTTTSSVLMMLLLMARTYVSNGADGDDAGAGGAADTDRDDDT